MRALTQWEPRRRFKELQDILGRLFGIVPSRTTNGGKESMAIAQWVPSVDIIEDDKEWLVKADLPEVKREDVKVVVENGVLTISGERQFEKPEKDRKYHRSECSYGNFLRRFTLPDGADGWKVNAESKDGVLEVHLPKSAKTKTPVDAESQQPCARGIDRLVRKYTCFQSMEALLSAKGIYRPSLYLPCGEQWARHEVNLIADEYNRRQEARGDPRRAFRLA